MLARLSVNMTKKLELSGLSDVWCKHCLSARRMTEKFEFSLTKMNPSSRHLSFFQSQTRLASCNLESETQKMIILVFAVCQSKFVISGTKTGQPSANDTYWLLRCWDGGTVNTAWTPTSGKLIQLVSSQQSAVSSPPADVRNTRLGL